MVFNITPEIAIAIALILVSSLIYLIRTTTKQKAAYRFIPKAPTNITKSAIVDLRVYPVKSCRGFPVNSVELLRTGLELDRQWMFVSWDKSLNKYKFITIRGDSKMTLINTSLNEKTDELVLSVDEPGIRVAVAAHPTQQWLEKHTEKVQAEIWSKDTESRMYPKDLTAEISNFLGKDVRLVYKGTHTVQRVLRGNGAPQILGREEHLGFADMMPVLVASLASMKELNSRLEKTGQVNGEFNIERFRPNIIVEGNTPWEEDSWKILRISSKGDNSHDTKNLNRAPTAAGPPFVLDVASRCMRCQVPNVDPDTAEKHAQQPWDVLMKYRRIDEGSKYKPAFGMLCCPRNEGRIEVGMQLEVLETVEDHLFRSPVQA